MSLIQLPKDVLEEIMLYLSPMEIHALCLTCKKMLSKLNDRYFLIKYRREHKLWIPYDVSQRHKIYIYENVHSESIVAKFFKQNIETIITLSSPKECLRLFLNTRSRELIIVILVKPPMTLLPFTNYRPTLKTLEGTVVETFFKCIYPHYDWINYEKDEFFDKLIPFLFFVFPEVYKNEKLE